MGNDFTTVVALPTEFVKGHTMTPEPDVTLTVTEAAKQLLANATAYDADDPMWTEVLIVERSDVEALDAAILAAPMPPPPELCQVVIGEQHDEPVVCGAVEAIHGPDLGMVAGHAFDPMPPPPEPEPSPMKEPERGDVVTANGREGIVLGFYKNRREVRIMRLGLEGFASYNADPDWITENHGPPEGDTWNGWEVG